MNNKLKKKQVHSKTDKQISNIYNIRTKYHFIIVSQQNNFRLHTTYKCGTQDICEYELESADYILSVSYTHLTLPTIYSV